MSIAVHYGLEIEVGSFPGAFAQHSAGPQEPQTPQPSAVGPVSPALPGWAAASSSEDRAELGLSLGHGPLPQPEGGLRPGAWLQGDRAAWLFGNFGLSTESSDFTNWGCQALSLKMFSKQISPPVQPLQKQTSTRSPGALT